MQQKYQTSRNVVIPQAVRAAPCLAASVASQPLDIRCT